MGGNAVFISYSHDSREHQQRVLEFSNSLRANGVDAELDRYHVRPVRGWPRWCAEMIHPKKSRYVLVVCTETYRDRVEGEAKADEGRGVFWEGGIILQYLYDDKGNSRFIPVLLGKEPERSIPDPLKGHTFYRIRSFDRGDEEYEALLRELHGRPIVKRPPVGAPPHFSTSDDASFEQPKPRPKREVQSTFTAPADISRIDRYAPAELVGREAETSLIDDAWDKAAAGEAHPRVMMFVALGGEGKTALVAKWAIGRSDKDWPGCEAAFAWSFYSQESSDQQAASSDLFLADALKFFGAREGEGVESAHDKGRRLASCVGAKRAVLILDGLEPLQYAPSAPRELAGRLKDDGLRALLKGLAQSNKGLCLVTTRYDVKDIEAYAATAPQIELKALSKEAGARLLERLGVRGTRQEREKLAEDVKGHALTLNIVGSYLSDACDGDIRQRDRIKLEEASKEQGGHAFRAIDEYVRWFESDGERGTRALAMLRLLGLFDRPADAGCLAALWRAPPIEGLTEPLMALSDVQRNIVLTRLAGAKLMTINREAGALRSLDAHPLLREYFASALREKRPDAWKAGHKRLYEHLTTTTPDEPAPTLDDLQPLYQAVTHGCFAGMQEAACNNVYLDRILRGTDSNGYYSTKKLGAFGADLGTVACFFDRPWSRVSSNLDPPTQGWLLNQAAFGLRALGRPTDALEPIRAALGWAVGNERWFQAAIGATNLSELELALGDVEAAVQNGQSASAYADRSGDPTQRMFTRTTYAEALYLSGRKAEARKLFAVAEAMQTATQPSRPLLYSLRGFQYCDLLLADAERAAWLVVLDEGQAGPSSEALESCRAVSKRSAQTLNWMNAGGGPLLDIGLNHLTRARVALYIATLDGPRTKGDHLREATDFLRRSGNQDHLPGVLLTRALFRALTDAFDGAREDLDEAYEIAERGPMKLHLADIHLHRARLFGLMAGRPDTYPWTSPRDDLDTAKKLIDECGYGRRREELADVEAAYQRIYGRG